LRGIQVAAVSHSQAGKGVGTAAEQGDAEVVLLGVHGSEIRPAQAEVDGEILSYLEVVLGKEAPEVLTLIEPMD
jgi:hypothetical protein